MFDVLAILIVLTAVVSYLNHKYLRLPDAVGVMVLTLAVSLGVVVAASYHPTVRALAEGFVERFDFGRTVLHGMLGFLLFAGALHVNLGDLRSQATPILLLSVVGTILTAFIVGGVIWLALAALGVENRLIYCFVFGALIAPTDPIAVLGLLKQARVSKQIEIQIVGESLFNDGIGVVLFTGLLGIASAGETFNLAHFAGLFIREAVGGVVFGLGIGLIAYWMCKSIDHYQVETLISLALVAGGFALADKIGISAPLAVVVAGLLMGNHGRTFAMSPKTVERLDSFWEMVDDLLNAVLFVAIGLEMLVVDFSVGLLVVGGVAVATVLIARLATVWLTLSVIRPWYALAAGTITISTWAGLRGGISVALALSLPSQRSGAQLPERDIIVSMTYVVVVFSILVQGLTVGPLARRLSRRHPTPDQLSPPDPMIG